MTLTRGRIGARLADLIIPRLARCIASLGVLPQPQEARAYRLLVALAQPDSAVFNTCRSRCSQSTRTTRS
jgi:hypothetical protein